MNKELIKQKIKELDKNNLFDKIEIAEDLLQIRFSLNYKEYSIVEYSYNALVILDYSKQKDEIEIGLGENIIYDKSQGINNIPLINFVYENKDKIKQVIKDNL